MATVASSKENKPKAPTRPSTAPAQNARRGAQTQSRAVAISNNDIAIIAWHYEAKIEGCLGFSVQRRGGEHDDWQPLPAWVGFAGGSNDDWQPKTTDEWPVQKFNWRDFTAKRGGTYQYRIVPIFQCRCRARRRSAQRKHTRLCIDRFPFFTRFKPGDDEYGPTRSCPRGQRTSVDTKSLYFGLTW